MTPRRASAKVAHVRAQAAREAGPGDHHCHWPGCRVKVPPAMWGCKPHWFVLPKRLRDAIWTAYRLGQEADKNPSAEYLHAARAAEDWVRAQGLEVPRQGELL